MRPKHEVAIGNGNSAYMYFCRLLNMIYSDAACGFLTVNITSMKTTFTYNSDRCSFHSHSIQVLHFFDDIKAQGQSLSLVLCFLVTIMDIICISFTYVRL